MPHRDAQVRAFSDEWSVHNYDIPLPAAGHQDHDAQNPDYCNFLPYRHVQVRTFSDQWPVHDYDILLPAASHQGNGAQHL